MNSLKSLKEPFRCAHVWGNGAHVWGKCAHVWGNGQKKTFSRKGLESISPLNTIKYLLNTSL